MIFQNHEWRSERCQVPLLWGSILKSTDKADSTVLDQGRHHRESFQADLICSLCPCPSISHSVSQHGGAGHSLYPVGTTCKAYPWGQLRFWGDLFAQVWRSLPNKHPASFQLSVCFPRNPTWDNLWQDSLRSGLRKQPLRAPSWEKVEPWPPGTCVPMQLLTQSQLWTGMVHHMGTTYQAEKYVEIVI